MLKVPSKHSQKCNNSKATYLLNSSFSAIAFPIFLLPPSVRCLYQIYFFSAQLATNDLPIHMLCDRVCYVHQEGKRGLKTGLSLFVRRYLNPTEDRKHSQ